MKYIIFMLFFLLSSVYAEDIHWAKDYSKGMAEASLKNKPVLFVFSRHSCYYCRVLDKTTFKDEKIIKALNKDFISIISYTDENDYTPRELWRPGTPTLWFLNPNGEPIFQALVGAVDAENLLKALSIVKTEFNKKTGE